MLKQLLAMLALALLGFVPDAKAQMFAGYDSFCGIPVIVTPNPQTASAARDQQGNPVIYIDPAAMENWSASRIYSLAHECGHHKLGHVTPVGMWFRMTQTWATRVQELEADCWAAKALTRAGFTFDLARTARQFASQGFLMVGNYPSGVERARNVARCAEEEAGAPNEGADSCQYANDGECDEPTVCARGTDTTDCRGQSGGRHRTPPPLPPPAAICSTQAGSCMMQVAIPRNSRCFCATPMGPIPGIAQ